MCKEWEMEVYKRSPELSTKREERYGMNEKLRQVRA
jgi:hypothetical protein